VEIVNAATVNNYDFGTGAQAKRQVPNLHVGHEQFLLEGL
jgi:hypothetical protein